MINWRKTTILAALTAFAVSAAPVNAATADRVIGIGEKPLFTVTSLAGIGSFDYIDGEAAAAAFRSPSALAVGANAIYVADTQNNKIRSIAGGSVSTYVGTPVVLEYDVKGLPSGGLLDGMRDKSFLNKPEGLAIADDGSLYVADTANHAIRKVDGAGRVTTVAGDGVSGNTDARGQAARFHAPSDVVVSAQGILYVADKLNHTIRRIDRIGNVTTLNKSAVRPVEVFPGYVVDGGGYKDGKLSEALFNEPSSLVLDAQGNLYVSDSGNQRIRYIDLRTDMVTTVAGSGTLGAKELYVEGDYKDGAASEAKFNYPKGIALDADGGLIVADSLNHAIRYLKDGKVITLIGNAAAALGRTDGTESSARLQNPTDVAVGSDGTLYIADAYNNKIRQAAFYKLPEGLPTDGTISVVLEAKAIQFDARPELTNNRTMVPVRFIAEAVGYKVEYLPKGTDTIIRLSKGDSIVDLTIGKRELTRKLGNVQVSRQIDVEPYIKDDRTYVPVRFFAEEIGLDVQWVQAKQTVVLRMK